MLERSPNEVELPLLAEPQTTAKLPPLIEPQLTDISPLALGLEGCEEAKTAEGIVFYRQGWWCRMR